jgi:gamma-glutamylcyclotransferase (GGCT)/AIG2-like uncharacterized protein YtfP
MNVIFVYGSLMSGFGNHRLLARARLLGPARTVPAFTLISLGAYPGMLAGGTTSVAGELYEVDANTLTALDRFEGVPHFYQRLRIRLAGGRVADAYVLPASQRRSYPVIETGDWRTFGSASS